ncbi:MAG: serine--tRNA ligase, partial [Micrococcales bacterium]|nr:serine--tRNA ligase [Micrococcales bacterium]
MATVRAPALAASLVGVIDPKLLRDNPQAIRASQQARGGDLALVDLALAADQRHRSALAAYEAARAKQKAAGKLVAAAKPEDKQAVLAKVQELAGQVKQAGALADAEASLARQAALAIPNLV